MQSGSANDCMGRAPQAYAMRQPVMKAAPCRCQSAAPTQQRAGASKGLGTSPAHPTTTCRPRLPPSSRQEKAFGSHVGGSEPQAACPTAATASTATVATAARHCCCSVAAAVDSFLLLLSRLEDLWELRVSVGLYAITTAKAEHSAAAQAIASSVSHNERLHAKLATALETRADITCGCRQPIRALHPAARALPTPSAPTAPGTST